MKLRHELAIVLILLCLAAPSRLLGLDSLPPGLFHDEAYEGIDAARIAAGARPVFLPENYGREPLYAYVMSVLIGFGGSTAVAVRATSAIFGLLAIPTAYLWGRVFFGPACGLLVAALTTSAYWMLHESRLGMRPISLPMFLALTSALAWLAARRGRWWGWPLAGLCLGLSLYTYLPARLFPLVVLGQIGLGLLAARGRAGSLRGGLIGLVALAAIALTVAWPLLAYFRENPADASARSAVVSILASDEAQQDPLGTLARNALATIGMFVWRGDDTVRHNLPFRPVFDWFLAPFFVLGVFASLRRLRQPEHAALWLWLSVMLLPGVLSDSAPHFLRTIGLLPALFVLPALGLSEAASALHQRLSESGSSRRSAPGGVAERRAATVVAIGLVLVLLGTQLSTWQAYFLELPAHPELAEAFDAPRAQLARLAGNPPPGLSLELPTPGWSHATIRFLRPRSFDRPAPQVATDLSFGTARNRLNADLLGFSLEPSPLAGDQPARLSLHWHALREMNANYVVSLRLVDAYNRVWWQHEGEPGSGTLPTDTWMPGEYVDDHVRVDLTEGVPAGELQLELALLQPDRRRRLSAFDSSRKSVGSSLRLASIRVESADR